MDIKLKGTNLELTDAIREHVDTRISSLQKYIDPNDTSFLCDVEVEKTTDHHKSGEIYRAEVNIHIAGHDFRAEAIKEKLFDAIDEAKNEMARDLRRNKKKTQKSIRKGGLRIKEILRGFRS